MADARVLTLQDHNSAAVSDSDAIYVGNAIGRRPAAVLSAFDLLTDANVGTIAIGQSGQIAQFYGTLQVDETSALNGDVSLGDALGDLVQINVGTVHFSKEDAHAIVVDPSVTVSVGGGVLTITSGQGSPGASALDGASGGTLSLGAGDGGACDPGASNGGEGGGISVLCGNGGIGDVGFWAGGGGSFYLKAGDAGAANGGSGSGGGSVDIHAGVGTGGNSNGNISIGNSKDPPLSITIGEPNCGILNLDAIQIEILLAGTSLLLGTSTTLQLQAGMTLDCHLGIFALPLQFYIDDPTVPANQVSANFTAVNASTLVDGGSAAGLHTHPGGGGGSTTDLTGYKAGETISKGAGARLAWDAVNGETRIYNACADSTDPLPYVIGLALDDYAADDDATVRMLGETEVPANWWVNPPIATSDIGQPVYLSDQTGANKGMLALAADIPTGSGDFIVRVGYVSLHSILSADAKVVVMKHEETKKS